MSVVAETYSPRIELNLVPPEESNFPYHGLEVTIGQRNFVLPYEDVGRDGEHVFIPYFHPIEDPELGKAGAQELAKRFVDYKVDIVFTPSSRKSVPMMERAIDIASKQLQKELQLFVVRKENKDDFDSDSYKDVVSYETITPPYLKAMAFSNFQLKMIKNLISESGTTHDRQLVLALADDVISSGGTITTLRKVVARASRYSAESLPAFAVIQEFPIRWGLEAIDGGPKIKGGIWKPEPDSNNHPVIITPVILG